MLQDNLRVIGIHIGRVKDIKKYNKINEGIPLNLIFSNIPSKYGPLENMIQCYYFMKYEDIAKDIKVYNNMNNIENKIIKLSINNENKEEAKIINGKIKFHREGNFDIKYYFNEEIKNLSYIFYNCPNLYKADLLSLSNNKIENMFNIFGKCKSLEKVYLFSFNTNNVINMSNMFKDCISLKRVYLSSSFNTNKVTNMSYMFSGCRSLEELDLSSFNTKNVVDMSYMFNDCSSLEIIKLSSSFYANSILNIEYMFNNCKCLEELDLSSFITENAIMDNIFDQCSSLKNIHTKDIKIQEEFKNKG